MSSLSKEVKQAFLNPLSKDNPVIVQILGICSALAVTAKMEPAFVMGISVSSNARPRGRKLWLSLRQSYAFLIR